MTLTQAASTTKRSLVVFAVLLLLSLSSYIGYRIWYAHYLASLPPIEEKPDIKFGTLPRPGLPTSTVTTSNFSYTIDTITGSLPDFGKIHKVFFIPKANATLLSLDKIKLLAKKLNLEEAIATPSSVGYFFQKDNRTLIVDGDTGNFSLKVATLSGKLVVNNQELNHNFKSVLAHIGLLTEDLKDGPTKINDNQINLWPSPIDKLPILYSNINQGLINATVLNHGRDIEDYQIINFIYWPVDQTTYSTYPIKSGLEALNDLKSGLGSIIIEPTKPQVSITSIYLAYFESNDYSPYLQPIYVFEGPGFVAFIPAIKSDYLTAKNSSDNSTP